MKISGKTRPIKKPTGQAMLVRWAGLSQVNEKLVRTVVVTRCVHIWSAVCRSRFTFFDHLKIDGLGALAASIRFGFEGDALATVQRRHTGAFNSGDVHENIVFAIIRGDEAKAFVTLEELYGTGLTRTAFHRPTSAFGARTPRAEPALSVAAAFTTRATGAAAATEASTAAVATAITAATAVTTTATVAAIAATATITAITAAAAVATFATTAIATTAFTVATKAPAAAAAVTTTAVAVTIAAAASIAAIFAIAVTTATTATTAVTAVTATFIVSTLSAAIPIAVTAAKITAAKITAEVLRTAKFALATATSARAPVRITVVHYQITLTLCLAHRHEPFEISSQILRDPPAST